jgi:hypothetical protein
MQSYCCRRSGSLPGLAFVLAGRGGRDLDRGAASRVGNGIRAVDRIELVHEGADMELGSVNRDPEPAGDGLVGSALSEKLKDLQFPWRQSCAESGVPYRYGS